MMPTGFPLRVFLDGYVRLVRRKLDASDVSPIRHGWSAGGGLLFLQAGYR